MAYVFPADAPWVNVAAAKLGLHENSPTGRTLVPEFFRIACKRVLSYKDAWCAAFVGWCLIQAGFKGSGSAMARSYEKFGKKSAVRVGAIAVFARTGSPIYGHVGFIVEVRGTKIRVLGGNQSNAVTYEWRDVSELIACRWPVERLPVAPSQIETEDEELEEAPPEPEPVTIHHETPQEVERRLRDSGSRTIETSDDIAGLAKKLGFTGVFLKLIEWVTDMLSSLSPVVDQLKYLATWCANNFWIVVIVVMVLIVLKSDLIKKFRISDALNGLHIGR